MKNSWVEGEDYYFNAQGLIVLTAKYHSDRGHCCGNGCKHCPYNYMNVPEPRRSTLQPVAAPVEDINTSK